MKITGAVAAIRAFRDAVNGDVVSEAEVKQRTSICKPCPKRELVRGIGSRISQKLGNLANVHRVPDEVSKYRCGVCGCSLMLLLPATAKDLHKDSPEEAKKRPESCWLTAASKSG